MLDGTRNLVNQPKRQKLQSGERDDGPNLPGLFKEIISKNQKIEKKYTHNQNRHYDLPITGRECAGPFFFLERKLEGFNFF